MSPGEISTNGVGELVEKSTSPTLLPHYSSGPSWKAFCTFRGCPSKIELQAPMATHRGVAFFFLPDILPPASWDHPTNEIPVHNCLSQTLLFFFFWRGKWWWWWSAGETQAKQTPWSVMQCWEATDETCTRQHGWMGKAECRVGGGEEEGANKIFKAAQSTYVKNARTQITGHFA